MARLDMYQAPLIVATTFIATSPVFVIVIVAVSVVPGLGVPKSTEVGEALMLMIGTTLTVSGTVAVVASAGITPIIAMRIAVSRVAIFFSNLISTLFLLFSPFSPSALPTTLKLRSLTERATYIPGMASGRGACHGSRHRTRSCAHFG